MKIILAVDGSKYSRWAVDLLLRLPLAMEPEIYVMHVVDLERLTHPLLPPPLALQYSGTMRKEIEKDLAESQRLTARVAAQVRGQWKRVRPVNEKGHVAEKIITRAQKEKADLIILGSRGLGDIKAFLLGSVSQQVATYAFCSVLIVKKKIRAFKKIHVAVDGSKNSETAVRFFSSRFLPKNIEGYVVHARNDLSHSMKIPVEPVEKKAGREMRLAGFKMLPMSLTGHPAEEIVETARKKGADLVVVGSRGLTGFKRYLLGSVSHKVMKYCDCSVLVVRKR